MNIAFDMFFARTDAFKRGIGRYSQSLIESILTVDTQHTYFYFYPDITQGTMFLKNQLQQFLRRNHIDVYHIMSPFNLLTIPSHLIPVYKDAVFNKEWFGQTRVVATLYDVIPLIMEKDYMNDLVRPIYMSVMELVRSCDIVYSISETTKNDAVRLAGIDANKIKVIMCGLDAQFKPIPNFNPLPIRMKYGIEKSYVLVIGGDDPRKNLERLISSFIAANGSLLDQYQLVVVYNAKPYERVRMLQEAELLGASGSIVVTGYVPDEDLVELYNGATLFVFPSLYEGFGLPVAEAMACGVAVLTSNNSSLAEIGGEAAYLVNPEDSDSITNGILQLLSNPKKLAELSIKGPKQALKFDWLQVAKKVLDGYDEIKRGKIAVFSPRHSLYTDGYGAVHEAIPYLTNRYDIDVYAEEVYADDHSSEEDSPIVIYPHTEFEQNKHQYDCVIYEIGNEDRYLFVVPYICNMGDTPGVVLLNNVDLYELTLKWSIRRNSIDSYFRVMQKAFGIQAEAYMDALLAGQLASKDLPINRYYLGDAKAIIVYSKKEGERLNRQDYQNVIVASAPAYAIEAAQPSDTSDFIFSAFITDSDRIVHPVVLNVLSEMLKRGCRNWKCRVAGSCDPKKITELNARIRSLGFEKHIEYIGELTAKSCKKLLRKTNAAVFLQDPEGNEAPAAPFLTLASGIPTIVFAGGCFDELPDDAILTIPAGVESESALLRAMMQLYENASVRLAYRERALAYMEENHSIAQFAGALHDAIDMSAMKEQSPAVIWRVYQTPDGVPYVLK